MISISVVRNKFLKYLCIDWRTEEIFYKNRTFMTFRLHYTSDSMLKLFARRNVSRRPLRLFIATLGVALFTASAGSGASNTLTYRYDAQGRLITSCNAVSSNTFAYRTVYSLDKAANRQNLTAQNFVLNIPADTSIWSPDGTHQFRMQSDGNLVLYGPSGATWASNTSGSGGQLAAMQNDGNLVVYTSSAAVWSSGTSGNYCARLQVQNDGNVVIYAADDTPIWSTNTAGR